MQDIQRAMAGKMAIVTGAASGIGAGIARLLAAHGCRVVVADVDHVGGRRTAEELGNKGYYCHLDVTSEDSWQALVSEVSGHWGAFDILVNNAGIGSAESIEEVSIDVWQQILAVNATGVFLGCRCAIQSMKETGGGSIINISSALGLRPLSSTPAYGASKAAVVNLTKTTALQCAEKGYQIRCNAINPGFIMTPLLENAMAAAEDPDALLKGYSDLHPVGCVGTINDVAQAALFLAGDESQFITGIALPVDGGMTI
ncbi:MAG: glucose 1-dehydrogenase [Porticoccaceae bacterium]|nr:glucose 1-dehydrogenase [Porticoccaceae bacterium]